MNLPSLVVGVLVLVAVTADVLWTALWADRGAGPLSSRLTASLWRGLRRVSSRRYRLLELAGPIVLVATLVTWIGLIWAGWTLVFAAGEDALVDTRGRGPITWSDRIYFVGYTTFTLGIGDFVPTTGAWQFATVIATANGMLFVTLGVSYVLSVVGAVVDKRSFASTVFGVGDRSEAFARAGWTGEDFSEMDLPLDTLSSQLNRLAKQHRAYPILHYYHGRRPAESSATAVAVFDDALTLLRFGVPAERRPNSALVEASRSSVEEYLETTHSVLARPADETPPRPDLQRLRDAGVPAVADAEFDRSLDDVVDRRRKLLGLVESDARQWPARDDE